MEISPYGQLEQQLDELRTRVESIENVLTQLPFINMQADPSRPAGVIVEPAALVVDGL